MSASEPLDNAPMLPNSGAVVHGTIIVGVLLAAERAQRESYAATIGAIAIAMLVYWLAHAYSEFTGHRLEHRQPLTVEGLAEALGREFTIVIGAAVPVFALVVCWAAGVRLTSAVWAALFAAAAVIVIVEVGAGVRAELSARALVAQTAAGALFGVLVIALKVVLH
jgi:membrane protein YqaA with SNARE-associated domain